MSGTDCSESLRHDSSNHSSPGIKEGIRGLVSLGYRITKAAHGHLNGLLYSKEERLPKQKLPPQATEQPRREEGAEVPAPLQPRRASTSFPLPALPPAPAPVLGLLETQERRRREVRVHLGEEGGAVTASVERAGSGSDGTPCPTRLLEPLSGVDRRPWSPLAGAGSALALENPESTETFL